MAASIVAAARLGGQQHQHRPQPFARGQQAIAHRLAEPRAGSRRPDRVRASKAASIRGPSDWASSANEERAILSTSLSSCLIRPLHRYGSIGLHATTPSSLRRPLRLVHIDIPEIVGRCPAVGWLSWGRAAPAAAFAGLVLVDRGRVVEGLGDRVALGIDAAEQFDPPLGPLQQFVRLPQQLDPFFVPLQRLVSPISPSSSEWTISSSRLSACSKSSCSDAESAGVIFAIRTI